MNSIEETLKTLSKVMAAHKRALAGNDRVPQPGIPITEILLPNDPRAAVMHTLMRDIQRISGIQVSDALEQKIVRLFADTSMDELKSWIRHLRLVTDDHPQWQQLIEALTVHETYFYRDRPQLDYFAAHALPDLIREATARGNRHLRIWSAGCATGEEAYTLAILTLEALLAAGHADELPNSGFRLHRGWSIDVLGTDISRAALKQATRAEYATGSLSSFRDLPSPLLRYFPATEYSRGTTAQSGIEPTMRRVRDDIRRLVRFQPHNLILTEPPAAEFDAVICRNVLIYLAPEPARQSQLTLHKSLRPGGYLLLGPTDTLILPQHYATSGGGTTFVHRRKDGVR